MVIEQSLDRMTQAPIQGSGESQESLLPDDGTVACIPSILLFRHPLIWFTIRFMITVHGRKLLG
jgi:hypothetical protein